MSPHERAALRQSLDGAVLNVALIAASLRTGRRLQARVNNAGRYALKIAGSPHDLVKSCSAMVAVNFLDAYGVAA